MDIGEVRRVPADELDGVEGWDRLSDDPEIRGVEAIRAESNGPWQWSVTVWAMEIVRQDPLEATLQTAIEDQLRNVQGVTSVAHDDREVWIVDGSPSGEELARAAAIAVDGLEADIRSHYEALG